MYQSVVDVNADSLKELEPVLELDYNEDDSDAAADEARGDSRNIQRTVTQKAADGGSSDKRQVVTAGSGSESDTGSGKKQQRDTRQVTTKKSSLNGRRDDRLQHTSDSDLSDTDDESKPTEAAAAEKPVEEKSKCANKT